MTTSTSCDGGCGTTDQPGAITRLTRVRLTVGSEKALAAQEVYEGDLCPVCSIGLLRGYFGIRPPVDPFEVPPFVRGAV